MWHGEIVNADDTLIELIDKTIVFYLLMLLIQNHSHMIMN